MILEYPFSPSLFNVTIIINLGIVVPHSSKIVIDIEKPALEHDICQSDGRIREQMSDISSWLEKYGPYITVREV